MEFICVNQMLESGTWGTFPMKLLSQGRFAYGAIDDNKMICAYLMFDLHEDGAILTEINISEDKRSEYIGGLIEAAKAGLYEEGADQILFSSKKEEHEWLYDVLADSGFEELVSEGSELEYKLSCVYESEFGKKLDSLQKYLVGIKYINSLTKAQKGAFVRNEPKRSAEFDFNKMDRLFSRIYVENDEIAGIADMEEKPYNVLNMHQMYIRDNKKFQIVFPLLVCSALDIARKTLEKDALFRISTTDEKLEKAITMMLGEPDVRRKNKKMICYL